MNSHIKAAFLFFIFIFIVFITILLAKSREEFHTHTLDGPGLSGLVLGRITIPKYHVPIRI